MKKLPSCLIIKKENGKFLFHDDFTKDILKNTKVENDNDLDNVRFSAEGARLALIVVEGKNVYQYRRSQKILITNPTQVSL